MTPDAAISMCAQLLESSILDWWATDTIQRARDNIRETHRVTEHQAIVIQYQWDRHALLMGGK